MFIAQTKTSENRVINTVQISRIIIKWCTYVYFIDANITIINVYYDTKTAYWSIICTPVEVVSIFKSFCIVWNFSSEYKQTQAKYICDYNTVKVRIKQYALN